MTYDIDIAYHENTATFHVRPAHGRPVTYLFSCRRAPVGRPRSYYAQRQEKRYVVSLLGSTGHGFSTHTSYDAACGAALRRARAYAKAYSVPRGVSA